MRPRLTVIARILACLCGHQVIFGSQGALAGVQGVASVAVAVDGLPLRDSGANKSFRIIICVSCEAYSGEFYLEVVPGDRVAESVCILRALVGGNPAEMNQMLCTNSHLLASIPLVLHRTTVPHAFSPIIANHDHVIRDVNAIQLGYI